MSKIQVNNEHMTALGLVVIDDELEQVFNKKTSSFADKSEIKKTFSEAEKKQYLSDKEAQLLQLKNESKKMFFSRNLTTGKNCIAGGLIGSFICLVSGITASSFAGIGIPVLATIAGAIGSELIDNKEKNNKELSTKIKSLKREIKEYKKLVA